MTCKRCIKKKRRNPEDRKHFIRICLDCENLFLRKILFEEFWNEKVIKEKDIEIKKEERALLRRKIELREAENIKRQNKQSELKNSTEVLNGIKDQLDLTHSLIKKNAEREIQMFKDQLDWTERIMKRKEVLKEKEEKLNELLNQKELYKMQRVKNMHRELDLQLKIKYYLESFEEKTRNQKKSKRKNSRKSSVKKKKEQSKSKKSANLSIRKMNKLQKKSLKYEERKNAKLSGEEKNCASCKACRIF